MDYNKKNYRIILESIIYHGYKSVDFLTLDVEKPEKQIILRHDIDYSLSLALEMAEIDAEYKIKSTFALLLSSPLYNPFTATNIKIIDEIKQLGHNIVLHHRVESRRTSEEMKQDIVRETKVMRSFFPYIQPVFIWHNLPSNNLLSNIEVPGMVNAYSATFVERMHYISDSVLRHKPDYFLTTLGKHKFLHLLLHPIIWMSEKDNMVAMISYALSKIILDCNSEFILNPAWKAKFPDGIPEEPLDKLEEFLNIS